MRRISASGLRFALLVYGLVNSRRQIRAFLELLASPRFKRRTVLGLRFALLVYDLVNSRRQIRAFLELLASTRFTAAYCISFTTKLTTRTYEKTLRLDAGSACLYGCVVYQFHDETAYKHARKDTKTACKLSLLKTSPKWGALCLTN